VLIQKHRAGGCLKVLFFFLLISTTAFSKAFYVSVPCSSYLSGRVLVIRAKINKTEKYLGLVERQEKALREADLEWMQKIAFETSSTLERLRSIQRNLEKERREFLGVRPFPDSRPMVDGVNHEIKANLSSELARAGLFVRWFGGIIPPTLKDLNRICFMLEAYWYLTAYRMYFYHRLDDITPSALEIETHDADFYGPAAVFAAKQLGGYSLATSEAADPESLMELYSEMIERKDLPRGWRDVLIDTRQFIRFFKPARSVNLFAANQVIIKSLKGILTDLKPKE